ncbi:hypothetical protein TNCV_2208581 [Trichonephila clavipes]|nr:hypothetical protein TNCV_2208581 [Trichonephila clavipes]
MCSRRHGGGLLDIYDACRRRDAIVYQQKGTGTPQLSGWQIQFLAASGKQISRKTVARRLGRRAIRTQTCCVCPIDQTAPACCPFAMAGFASITIGLNRTGHAYYSQMRKKYQEKDRYPTCHGIMVWAGIMINGRTRPHVVANGTMTGQRYIDEVLLYLMFVFFRGAVGDKFVFMDDNATCHRTLAVRDCPRQ